MSRWRVLVRWVAAVVGVGVLFMALALLLKDRLGSGTGEALGPRERRINTISDLGDDDAATCGASGIRRGEVLQVHPLRKESTACVVVGVTNEDDELRWFFMARATGQGTVAVPRPTRSGTREVLLENGAVVPIGANVAVRCSPDPNERFETWIARGLATTGYLDSLGFLVALDCELPES